MNPSERTQQRIRRGTVGLALATALGCGSGAPESLERGSESASSGTTPRSTGVESCTVERRPLVLADGRHAYVEPTNLMRVGDDHVVVGAPSYTWEVGGSRVRMTSEGAHIAAYLTEEPPRLVETPIDVDATSVRAVPLDDRRWGVVFSEPDPDTVDAMGSLVRVWYAEYDGEHWTDSEELPLPAGHDLFVGSSSALVEAGGSLSWAVLDRNARAVQLYERVEGVWSFSSVPDSDVEAVALATGPSGTWLALSGMDPGVSGPRKSVRLLRAEAGWELVSRNPTAEPYTEITQLTALALASGVALTWVELQGAGRVVARVGIGRDDPGTVVLVDDAAPVVRLFGMDGGAAWLVQHHNPVSGVVDLRLSRLEGGELRRMLTMEYPYTGYYAALAVGPDEVLVTGSEFDPDPARPTVRSLTLRLNPSCR